VIQIVLYTTAVWYPRYVATWRQNLRLSIKKLPHQNVTMSAKEIKA